MTSAFYAVAQGRDGPAIYRSWNECKSAVNGFSGAVFKKFTTRKEAKEFIGGAVSKSSLSEEKEEKKRTIDIFIDGACKNNGKAGARAAYACHFPHYPQYDKAERCSPGEKGETPTNNRAEYSALLLAHRQAARLFADYPELENQELTIYTDSELLYKSVNFWLPDWKTRGWKRKNGDPVANVDLLREIDSLSSTYPGQGGCYSLHHVKAHTDKTDYWSVNNAIVDSMASKL